MFSTSLELGTLNNKGGAIADALSVHQSGAVGGEKVIPVTALEFLVQVCHMADEGREAFVCDCLAIQSKPGLFVSV